MRVAAIDLGTNSTRLLVVDSDEGKLHREAVVTGLGRGVDRNRRFDPQRLQDTLDVLGGFAQVASGLGVDRLAAVATSASRDADNGDELLDRAESLLGVRPRIVAGAEEAALAFAGATASTAGQDPTLVIDVGGGSTEFIFGTGRPEYAVSVDIGSVRLTERCIHARPALPSELVAARAETDRVFAAVDLPGRPATVVGVAGTFTSLAAIDSRLPGYDRTVIEGYDLTLDALESMVARLAALTVEETAAIPALDPKRAPVILAGAILGERTLTAARVDAVTVSEHDLLDGLAAQLL